MPKLINNKIYYSLVEAARAADVSHMTMYRWVTKRSKVNGIKIPAIKDSLNNRYYVSENIVRKLTKRFQPV